jgi:hypothetical protein
MRFEFTTVASPEQVRRAFTDFTDRRLQIWARSLDPSTYELRELGDTWAVARESSPRSPFWVVSRYDWSDPAVIRWTVVDSSYGGGGEGSVHVEPGGHGGSRVHATWNSTDARLWQRPLLLLVHRGPVGRMIAARMWASALDAYAQDDRV